MPTGASSASLARRRACAARTSFSPSTKSCRRSPKRIQDLRVASIVVLDALTGGSWSWRLISFDPNEVSFKVDLAQWKRARAESIIRSRSRASRPVSPGSTFKVVTALAGLEAGVITPEGMTCPAVFSSAVTISAAGSATARSLCTRRSSSPATLFLPHGESRRHRSPCRDIAQARAWPNPRRRACRTEGGIDTKWKRKTLGQPWYPGETISCGIGQGYVSTTPLQLAVTAARIATGREVRPHLYLARARAASLNIDPVHLELVRGGMVGVVNEKGGTAVRSRSARLQCANGGKTGTSQVISARIAASSRGGTGRPTLFIAYAPVVSPHAAACVVEHGGGGSRAAAPGRARRHD